MIKRTLFLFLMTLIPQFSLAADFKLTNMGPEFKLFIDHFRSSSPKDRWNGWLQFENKYHDIFTEALCDVHENSCAATQKKLLENFFSRLPAFEDSMWTLFDSAETLTSKEIEIFKNHFPDIKKDIPVIFMPSLLTFNGKGGLVIHGVYSLAIGADFAAFRHNNIPVLFSHEFFHTYQFDILKDGRYQTMASPLWLEGFAVWGSSVLHPEASKADILMNADLARYCATPHLVSVLARSYISFLDLPYSDDKSLDIKKSWFYANSDTQPQRQGYCLGFKTIAALMKKKSSKELIPLDELSFSNLLKITLQSM